MKRGFFITLMFLLCSVFTFSQTAVSLAEAIRIVASDIGSRLGSETRIAVVNFGSASPNMNNHVLGELNNALANERNLTVVGRGDLLESARQELNLNISGEVSDASAQDIGRFLGAQMVVSGSLSIAGADYSFRVQVLEVETAAIRYSQTFNIQNDRQVRTLMGDSAIVQNFTPGERTGTAVLNLALGLGSFTIQKDGLGGGVTAALEAAGVAAVIVSRFLEDPGHYEFNNDTNRQEWVPDSYIKMPVLIGGLSTYAAGVVFGIYRALSYQKPGVNVANADGFYPWDIALISTPNGDASVRLSYTLRF